MTPEQRNRLADFLVQWEDLYHQGQDTPVDVLCKCHPELAETLARHIAALKRVAWLDKKLEDNDDDPSDAPPNDPRPPKVLAGRYRLEELIATGGFAEVWRAFDQELQRIIAVKIPKRTVVGSAESFLAEARRVARLKHPAILPVYDVGVDDGEFFSSVSTSREGL
jgi:serine/threonine protein kinase